MQSQNLIREIAAKAFSEALQEKSRELAEDVASRMEAALELQEPGLELRPVQAERTKELRDGAMLISGSRSQAETLETLVAASSALTPSCGLLVLRGAQATGFSCIGLTAVDNFKRATMDCSKGVAATVIRSCAGIAVKASELDPAFAARLGLESSTEVLLLPVLLKEHVAALLIALPSQGDDLAGLELLVQVTQLALDVQAYRKAAQHPAVAPAQTAVPPRAMAPPSSGPAQTAAVPRIPSPLPAPVHAAPSVTAQPETPVYSPSPAPTYAAPVSHPQPPAAAPVGAPAFHMNVTPPAPAASLRDEAHDRARRFAKLLVEEIKLYNQTKVAEGRARADLYSRLRDDIETSRAAYQKRYGEAVRDVDYFSQELLRILADNNPAAMGAGFPS